MTQALFDSMGAEVVKYVGYGITAGVVVFGIQFGARKGFAWFKKLSR